MVGWAISFPEGRLGKMGTNGDGRMKQFEGGRDEVERGEEELRTDDRSRREESTLSGRRNSLCR